MPGHAYLKSMKQGCSMNGYPHGKYKPHTETNFWAIALLSFWVTFGIPNYAWPRPFITSMDVYPQTKNQFHTTTHSWEI